MVGFSLYDVPPPFIPPHKGEGVRQPRESLAAWSHAEMGVSTMTPPSALWGGIKGGGSRAQTYLACKPRNAA